MIDRYLLRYLLAVVDKGSFTRAAEHCGVSQPTLSAGIAKLETEVGGTLILRANRRIELTGTGVRWVDRARRIEREFTLAEQETRSLTTGSALRIGVLSSIPVSWMQKAMTAVHEEDGAQRIEIVEASEKVLLAHLDKGRLDVLLSVIRPARSGFSEPVFEEGYSLVMPASHPLSTRKSVDAEEVADAHMIVRRHCEALPETSRHFTSRGVRPFMSARLNSDEQALSYVRAGHGLTVMPDCHAGPGIAMAGLSGFDLKRKIGFIYDQILQERPKSEALTIIRETITMSRNKQKTSGTTDIQGHF